jgi:inosine/xanthosine triphosphate pyrophosphatase family protein
MKDLEGDDRKARMRVACALRLNKDHEYIATGSLEGHVPKEPYEKRHSKMPYRSLLFVDSLNKWFEDITKEDPVGYRKAAVEELKKYLI